MGSEKRSSLQKKQYSESGYRYINLCIYLLAALANSIPAQTFSSINSLVVDRYRYSAIIVTLNVLVFPILHPILAFPANWILDKFGMKTGCSIGGVFLIMGVWMRTLIEIDEPFLCFAGSVLAAIGNIFILNSASTVAANWFKPASIPGIISLSVLANLISVTVGASVPGIALSASSSSEDIQSFLRVEAIVVSVPIIIMLIGLKTKPPTPPSASAENRIINKDSYRETLKKLFSNKEYLKIALGMTFSYGTITSYMAILDQSLDSIGYVQPGRATAIIILSATVSGLFSTIFFARKIKQTLQYRKIISICLSFGILTFLVLQVYFFTKNENLLALIILGLCGGVFLIPYTALFTAYSSETIFPIAEGSATGYLFASSQTFGFVIGLISITIIENSDTPTWQIYFILALHSFLLILSLLSTLWTKQVLNRSKYEYEQRGGFNAGDENHNFIYSNTKYDNV